MLFAINFKLLQSFLNVSFMTNTINVIKLCLSYPKVGNF